MRRQKKVPSAESRSEQGNGLGPATSRLRFNVLLSSLVVLVAMGLPPLSASARETRFPLSFSPVTGASTGTSFSFNQGGLAVDGADGNLFFNNDALTKIFNAEGGIPVGTASPYDIASFSSGFTRSQSAVAVDNSATSPSKGAVYVGDTDANTVRKFIRNPGTESYEAAGTLTGSSTLKPAGLAVDSHGNVFVGNGEEARVIIKFSPSGAELARFPTSYRISDLAVDAAGDLFVETVETTPKTIYKYPANGFGEINASNVVTVLEIDEETGSPHVPPLEKGHLKGIAVAPGANQLFVAFADHVNQYDATSLVKQGDFGFGVLKAAGRLTADPAADHVYVADPGNNNIAVFGPQVTVPDVTANDVSDLSGTKATLSATVNPLGLAVTDCRFEYGTTSAYGTTKPCEGALPTDSNLHPVTAALAGLTPQGVTYHFRVVATNANGPNFSPDKTFVSGDVAISGTASAITDTAADLSGTVKPEGGALTDCQFEYGETDHYGASVPCSPPAGSIPADLGNHAVTGDLTGLTPNRRYHFRLVTTGSSGTFHGADSAFLTLGPPLVAEEDAAAVAETTATLAAQVNPRGFASSYHFEFGTDSSYGARLPASSELSAGSGISPVAGAVNLTGLQENTTYHFRVVASNGSGATNGPDQIFTTARDNASCPNATIRAGQTSVALPTGSVALPACMGLEMVTPSQKYSQGAVGEGMSVNGDRFVFRSDAALAETGRLTGVKEPYVASRTTTGWTTSTIGVPPAYVRGSGPGGKPCTYSPDLSRWSLWASTDSQQSLGITTAFEGGLDGRLIPISPLLTPIGSIFNPLSVQGGSCQGSSMDSSHEFFTMTRGLDSGGAIHYISGDPVPLLGNNANVYEVYRDESGTPTVELVQRDKDGVVYGATCGAIIGGIIGASGNREALRGSISPDASRVFFSTRPSQPEGVDCNGTANKYRVMQRLQTPAGPEISEISASECSRVAPPCNSVDADDIYQGASQEGTKVYFTTERQLASSDLDSGSDLYLYDSTQAAGSRLLQVSAGDASDPTPGDGAGVLGVVDFSGDGSHVYFVATGGLTTAPNRAGKFAEPGKPNLYLYERDAGHPGGRTVFIATLDAADSEAWDSGPGQNAAAAVPILGSDFEDQSVGGDGHILVFSSKAALTPGDTDGGAADIYRFDSVSGSLERVSKPGAGGDDNGPFATGLSQAGASVLPNMLSFGRSVSNNGRTIVFITKEALDPNDSDGEEGAYVWRDGVVTALLTASEKLKANPPTVSLGGEEVSFITASALLPEDGDAAKDVYMARAGGGFPPPVPLAPCQGEACQGPPSAQPNGHGAPSESFFGAGNQPKQAKCKKGAVRRRGKCVKQHAKKHRKHKSRSGRKHGGQK